MQNNYNFTTITKNNPKRNTFPEGVLRIKRSSMTISSADAARIASATKKARPSGIDTYLIGIEIDDTGKVFRLSGNNDGFTFVKNSSGQLVTAALPSDMRKRDIARQDYQLVEGTTNIYKLAE